MDTPIAIVGLGVRFPGAEDAETFWANLKSGKRQIPVEHVARIAQVDGFDWRAFSIPPNQARYLDPQHRLMLEVTWEAFEDAGMPMPIAGADRTAVYVGIQWNDYLRLATRDPERIDSYALTGNLFHFVANRISHAFGLRGPSMAVDMGCASSIAAVHFACQSLRQQEVDIAVAGGVELVLAPDGTEMMSQAGLLDANGTCHTMDARAAGFVRGEGGAVVILKRLEDVQPDERVYALLLGTAINHNGTNHWITAPSRAAQVEVMRAAWERAGITPNDLQYLELHGTASPTGDVTEAEAVSEALGCSRKDPLRIGSVKTQIGHLGAASGIAGLAKVALSIHHGAIPPGLSIETPNPQIAFEELRIAPQLTLSNWPGDPIAGVTAISLSGANAHAVLRNAPDRTDQPTTHDPVYLPISARTDEALLSLCQRYLAHLQQTGDSITDIAYTAGVRRTHHPARFCACGRSVADWVLALNRFLADQTARSTDELSQRYVRGAAIDFMQASRTARVGRVVSLPCYPWQRQSFWLPEERAQAAAGAVEALASILGREDALNPTDRLVDLGLDSLSAIKLSHVLEKRLGVKRTMPELLAATVADLDALERAEQPLSVGQQAFWFHHVLNPKSAAHHVILPLSMKGTLAVEALRKAFEQLVRRHPMLRASFGERSGKPFQRISTDDLPWQTIDASALDDEALDAAIREEGHRPFDLARGPMRLVLYQQKEDENLLLWVLHHIAVDFWSMAILLDELGEHYQKKALPPPKGSYFDFVAQERAEEEHLAFWREQLAGLSPLALPADADANQEQGDTHRFALNAELVSRVRALARAEAVTPFMVLLAAFQVLLHRLSGSDDVAVGTPTTRRSADFADVVGYFVNPVVIRSQLGSGACFQEVLRAVSTRCLAAFAHRDYPFPRLVEKLSVTRGRAHPLFQVMFALQQSHLDHRPDLSAFAFCDGGASGRLHDLTMTTRRLKSRAVQFDLNLMLAPDEAGGLLGVLEYSSRFAASTARRISGQYQVLLEDLLTNPEQPISPKVASEQTLTSIIADRVASQPDAIALDDPDTPLTYRALDERANGVMQQLAEQKVEQGDVVAVCLPHGQELVVCAWAVLKGGAVLLPLDPAQPAARLSWMMADAGAVVLLAEEPLKDLPCAHLRPASVSATLPPASVAGSDRAYIIYTSGSTGRPKGVMVSHAAIATQVLWRANTFSVAAGDRVLLLASPAFDIFLWEVFGPLAAGASIVIAPAEVRQDRDRLAQLIVDRGVTVIQLVSSAMAQLLEASPLTTARLRMAFCGGDALTQPIAQRFFETFASAELVQLYGPTEGVIDSTYYRCSRRGLPDKLPIGRAVEGTSIQLLEEGRAVPQGATGEIHLGGKKLCLGYRDASLNEQYFLRDPADESGRLYRTGDLARWNEEGALEFLGRRDDQVKVRGYRIELSEIEAVLSQHERVTDQAVIPVANTIVAFVVLEEEVDLRPYLLERLPDYMVPARFLHVKEIPRLPSGKIDRVALREAEQPQDKLQTEAEEMVAEVWSDLLQIGRFSPTASFFDLGGHSLLALQVAARLTECAGVEVPVRAVFEYPTVRALGAFLASCETASDDLQLLPLGRQESPLSFAQEGLWLVDQAQPGSLTFHVPQAFRLVGDLDLEALERAVNGLIERHTTLRTTFRSEGTTAVQEVHPPAPFELLQVDLRAGGLSQLIEEEAQRGFDLERGPLFRIQVAQIADDEHALLLNMHHIVSDGWSQAMLLDELCARYRDPGYDPPFGLQYGDYAHWERAHLSGERFEQLLSYWLTHLAGARSTPLPMAQSERASRRGSTRVVLLPESTSHGLRHLCQKESATLFMGAFAMLALLIHRYNGERDLVIGAPMSVRDRPELEPVVGLFVNMLPMRIRLAETASFRTLLAAVRESSMGAYEHRQVPFSAIVQRLRPERSPGAVPLLSVVFQLAGHPTRLALPGVTVTDLVDELPIAPLYLNFTMTPHDEQLELRVDYDIERFSAETIERMLDGYGRIIDAVVARPGDRLDRILRSLERQSEDAAAPLFSFER